jgi:heterodisulfide reductase subunit A
MMDVGRHPNVTLLTNSQVTEVKGKAGKFKVKVLRSARFIDESECTACGECATACPSITPSEFEEGLSLRKAIYSPFAQAVPSSYIRSEENCLGTNPIACGKCIDVCQKDCIDLDMADELIQLDIGSVICATGIDYYDPREASEYGYTRFENVVNSIELERLLSPGGPTAGSLVRFTDQKPPDRVSFIQCVGSRCINRDIPYCSRICCMNAMKSALLIREMYPDIEIDIFYIDIRAFGKGFEQFYHRAKKEGRVNFIKGKPSHIEEDPVTKDLILHVENVTTGESEKIRTQLAILSEAVVPSVDSHSLAKVLGIETDKRGFFSAKDACGDPIASDKEGIFLCGCSSGPKDITDSIAEASGAAIRASQFLTEHKLPKLEEEIPAYNYYGDPRVGVFICHCGSNIAGVLDVGNLQEYAKTLPDVVFSEELLFACSESTQRAIQQSVIDNKINRVVIAACTPRTHEPVFRETLRKIGLNPYLMEMANIRDQCSWVHQYEAEKATNKGQDLIRMAVARVRELEPLEPKEMPIGHDIVIIGGGIAGMETAIQLSRRGYKVSIVEKQEYLGGWTRHLNSLYPSGESGLDLVQRKLQEIYEKEVKIYTGAAVSEIRGYVGNFSVTLHINNGKTKEEKLDAGAIVLTPGFEAYEPRKNEYGYLRYPNVITNMDLEELLQSKNEIHFEGEAVSSVVFMQCVGSRGDEGLPECSRYCCQASIKQAIALRKMGIHVTVFNRDIRVYHHEAEGMYREARQLGVNFVRYEKDNPPQIIGNRIVYNLQFKDQVLKQNIEFPADLLVLAVGMRPAKKSIEEIQKSLKVPIGIDGFLMEKHPKFGPIETNIQGVFIAGCAQGPKDISDSISQANAVAAKIDALLSRTTIMMEPIASCIDELLCRGCATCVDVCEYGALSVVDKAGVSVAQVNEALCEGCGTCATYCPTNAIDIRHFRDKQIESMLEAFLLPGKQAEASNP